MAKHTETGLKGEEIAVNYLLNLGYKILQRNWRAGRREIDCIARDGDVLVFVEIKTRSNFSFGFPEEAVTLSKQQFLKRAAEVFAGTQNEFGSIRFDVISILIQHHEVREIKHIRDAFY